jgi:hypothetical protein
MAPSLHGDLVTYGTWFPAAYTAPLKLRRYNQRERDPDHQSTVRQFKTTKIFQFSGSNMMIIGLICSSIGAKIEFLRPILSYPLDPRANTTPQASLNYHKTFLPGYRKPRPDGVGLVKRNYRPLPISTLPRSLRQRQQWRPTASQKHD